MQTVLYVLGPFILYCCAGAGALAISYKTLQWLTYKLKWAQTRDVVYKRREVGLHVLIELYHETLSNRLLADQIPPKLMERMERLALPVMEEMEKW